MHSLLSCPKLAHSVNRLARNFSQQSALLQRTRVCRQGLRLVKKLELKEDLKEMRPALRIGDGNIPAAGVVRLEPECGAEISQSRVSGAL